MNKLLLASLVICMGGPSLNAMEAPPPQEKKQLSEKEQQLLNDELLHKAMFGPIENVQLTLNKGAQTNIRNRNTWTPLMLAASVGRVRVCKLLLGHGAELDAQTKTGDTALSLALHSRSYEAAIVLLEHGAQVDFPGTDGKSILALNLHELRSEACKLLLEYGARLKTKTHDNLLLAAAILDRPLIKEEFPLGTFFCNLLIIHSRFYQVHKTPKFQESQKRVWTILLCWKRLFPTLLRDVRKLILLTPELRQDTLNCPMGLCKELKHLMPIPILQTLICAGILDETQTIKQLKQYKFEQLIPLMNEALKTETDNRYLRLESLEENFGGAIEKVISEDLNIRNTLLMKKFMKETK